MNGRVKWFDQQRGYGFITPKQGPEVFIHHSGIAGSGFKTLEAGDEVQFEVVDGERGARAEKVFVTRKSGPHRME